MSRLDTGTLEVRRERRSLTEVIESIKDNLCNLTSRHRFQILIPGDLPPVAVDDRIGEVLTNLVENAVRYSPEGTQITLEAGLNGEGVVISVSDEGIGIPPELREKVFERFYQVADPVAGHTPGTGLGLSICRGIVEAHQGKIWVESESGKGARFIFSLPTN
jgi:signal transduction histidine kinase